MEDQNPRAEVKPAPNNPGRPLWVRFVHLAIRAAKRRKAEKKESEPLDKSAVATAAATVVIALFTIVLAWVGWSQLNEMQDSGDQTDHMIRIYRQQAASINRQANEMHDLAERTKQLADQAERQSRTAREAFEEDLRPIVSISDMPVRWTFPVFHFEPTLINSGKTRADNVFFHCNVYTGDKLMDFKIPPHGPRRMIPTETIKLAEDITDPDQLIVTGKMTVTAYCIVRYSWRKHTEHFCYKTDYQYAAKRFRDDGAVCEPKSSNQHARTPAL